jgi:hypothetical protein
MVCIYLATDDGVVVLRPGNGMWRPEVQLSSQAWCLAADPGRPGRLYCGTFGSGLWRSDDAGTTWHEAGAGLPYAEVMSVAVSAVEQGADGGVVWAGTEPSALFRSEDGGRHWQELPALRRVPSAPTWSFPPRPWTSHVRWIAPDPNEAERIFVGIELGGVMRSLDGGLSWEDRKPGSQHDSHTLATHALAPGRVYETAGGGYAETLDGGTTWHGDDAGLQHHYLWGLAVDPADPDAIVISAARGPRQAHDASAAEAFIYRRVRGTAWQRVDAGLPVPRGNRTYVLASHVAEPGVFFAANDRGIYRSPDAGRSWEQQSVSWPQGYTPAAVHAILVTGDA